MAGKELKVLMINTVPMRYEGITTVMLNYARNLPREGLKLDFLAINDVEPALRREIAGMDVGLHVIEGRNRHPVRYALALARLIRKNGYDIVHAHGNSCTLATELAAAKLGGAKVRCAHSHNTMTNSPRVHRLLRPVFDRSYTHALACGDAAGKWLFGDKPFEVLNNGTDAARYRFDPGARAACRAELGVGERTVVGHVGGFVEQKNHRFLAEAFARALDRNPNLALVLVGDGPERPAVEAKVRELGIGDKVIFTGVSREVPRLLSAMDLMVLPSLYEGLPNVVVEWQAAGLPSLVADTVTPDCRMCDLVEFLPLDVDAWANRMAEASAAADRSEASRLGGEAIARAGFDIRENARHLRELYLRYVQER